MRYCRVNNNNVVSGPMPLPKTFKNMSGFNLDPANAALHGWLPAIVTEPDIPIDHRKGDRIVEIGETVNITWEVVPSSQDEVFARNLQTWDQNMQAPNLTMPDFMEQHIKDDHNGVVSNPKLQKLYDDKTAVRGRKPTK